MKLNGFLMSVLSNIVKKERKMTENVDASWNEVEKDTKLAVITDAMVENRVFAITYTDPRGLTTTRQVKPSHVYVYSDGTAYVVGFCGLRNGVRTFNIGRISTLIVGGVAKTRENVVYPGTWQLRTRCAQVVKNVKAYVKAGWVTSPIVISEPAN